MCRQPQRQLLVMLLAPLPALTRQRTITFSGSNMKGYLWKLPSGQALLSKSERAAHGAIAVHEAAVGVQRRHVRRRGHDVPLVPVCGRPPKSVRGCGEQSEGDGSRGVRETRSHMFFRDADVVIRLVAGCEGMEEGRERG